MSRLQKVLVPSCAAVVVFDAVASIAALSLGFEYARAAIASWVLYAAVGFVVARGGEWWHALVVGIAMGATDASAGWAVSWIIGPGQLPDGASLTPALWIGTLVVLIVMGAALGSVGGALGRVAARSRPRAT